MKNIIRLSLVLLCLFVTTNVSNASVQSQDDSKGISGKYDYLPNYNTVNTVDSEEPVVLARRWGHYKRKHVCFDKKRSKKRRYPYMSRWCKRKRAAKAQRARKHYRRMVVKYHKRKALIKRRPICKIKRRLLNPKGIGRKKSRCYINPPWKTKHGKNLRNASRGRF